MAQEQCLALRAAEQLLSLASTNLLCEDDVGAGVQIAGTQFILGDVISRASKGRKVNGDHTNSFSYYCKFTVNILSRW